MNDKAGLAANQDYGKDESSAEKLLTKHTALQTAVDAYSPIIQGLAEQARKLVQSGHFAATKVATRQVWESKKAAYLMEHSHLCEHLIPSGLQKLAGKYRKLPIISPGLIFVQKAFLVGLFSGELIFGGAYYWREFCVSK